RYLSGEGTAKGEQIKSAPRSFFGCHTILHPHMSSPSQAPPVFTRSSQLERYFPAVVVGIALVTYLATLRFGFVYDDHQQIVNDPLIRSWHNLPLLFKTDVWRFWHPTMVGNYWRPLFMLWLLLNYKLFGLTAAGWHISSVLVHTVASYLCYR